MTCALIQDELDLYAGQTELPEELEAHVHACVDCTRYWRELNGFTEQWQRPDLFMVSRPVANRLSEQIIAALPANGTPRIFNIPYYIQYALAASVAVIGLSLFTLLYQQNTVSDVSPATYAEEDIDISAQLFAVTGVGDLSDSELEVLYTHADTLTDYSTEVTAWETFDDLTEDELDYLQNTLTAEDII